MAKQGNTRQLAATGTQVLSFLVIAIALTVLAGWLFHVPALRHFVPGYVSMNPVTAVCFVLVGVSLLLLAPAQASPSRRRFGHCLAGLVCLVVLIRLVSTASGWQCGIDQWLFAPDLVSGSEPPSRIAVRSAINLFLASLGLLLLDTRTARGRRPTELLCAIISTIAFLALLGYSYGLFLYYKAPDFVPMSLPGAIAFLFLATAMLLARPDEGVMRVITGDSPAGVLLRLLLPLAVLLPVLLGAFRSVGEEAGWYSSRVGVALFTTVFIFLFFASIAWTARMLFRSDLKRKAAEERVRQMNAALEQRVAERTAELQALNVELVAASKTKDNFLAALSHELRTPLTPVLLSASTLEREPTLRPDFREQVSMMRRNIELEARLIDDLLDLTRVAQGKLELRVGTADVHSLLRHSGEIVRNEASAKEVQVRLVLEAHEWHVAGDAARLHQVFWNILTNAIKFTPPGGEVVVQTSSAESAIRIQVRDSGVGIEPAVLPSIFTPFVQGEIAPGRTASGLGLGMAISKEIVELHGGKIGAASAGVGAGATFTVDLATVANAARSEGTAPPVWPGTKRRYRLLVVEDHQPTLEVLARLLGREGHDVTTANSVKIALQTAARAQFDLVISDLGLPDGNGVDLMVQLTRDYGLRGIALSGYGMDEDFARTKEAGFLAHLIKPIDFERLNEVIGRVAEAG